MNPSSMAALAFNLGSQARLDGEPVSYNPYEREASRYLWRYWQDGWQSVDQFWGWDSKRPVAPLPPVTEGLA